VSPSGGLIWCAEGVALETRPAIPTLSASGSAPRHGAGIVFKSITCFPEADVLVEWLRAISVKARRTCTCRLQAGRVSARAKPGCFHGNARAATHWLMCDVLQKRFPDLQVDRDAIFPSAIGSCGRRPAVTSCIDLSLALVEADMRAGTSRLRVARELVVFLKRPGGSPSSASVLELQTQDGGVFDDLHAWLCDHLASKELTVEVLRRTSQHESRVISRVCLQTETPVGRQPKPLNCLRLGKSPTHA